MLKHRVTWTTTVELKNLFRIPGAKLENNNVLIKIPEPVRLFIVY